jgi:AAA family ATPase
MRECRIGAGEVLLLSLVDDDAGGSGRAGRARRAAGGGGGSGTAASSFVPASTTTDRNDAAPPLDLWAAAGVESEASKALDTPISSWGRYATPAVAWPSARVARGAASASPATRGQLLPLSENDDDSSQLIVALRRYPGSSATPSPPSASIRLRLLLDQKTRAPLAAGGAREQGATWPLRLVQALASAAAAGGEDEEEDATTGRQRNQRNSQKKELALLARLAAAHVAGRRLLPGALVPLPLLGRSLWACVVAGPGAPAPESPSRHQDQPLILHVAQGARVDLLLGPPPPAARKTKAAAAAEENEDNNASSLVRLARRAAEAAVSGSGREAAADAAERAVRAGLAARRAAQGGFSALGGAAGLAAELRQCVALPLQQPQLFQDYGVKPPRGVLLHGPPGSGKSAAARAAAVDCGAALLLLDGPAVMSEFFGESEAGLRGVFAAAAALSPAVLFIDEIDSIAPSRGGGGGAGGGGGGGESAHTAAAGVGGGSDPSGRVLTQLLTLMDGAVGAEAGGKAGDDGGGAAPPPPPSRVVIVAATNRPDALDPALRRPGRLEREILVGPPDAAGRAEILRKRLLLQSASADAPAAPATAADALTPADVDAVAAGAHGFVGADLAALANEAAMGALRRHVAALEADKAAPSSSSSAATPPTPATTPYITRADLLSARLRVAPSALREVAVEIPLGCSWRDVGGLDDVKARLKEAVEWPSRRAAALKAAGARAPRGVLLYGPPGCSKTLLARAAAAEARVNFLSVRGGELLSAYVGASERAVAALFARARASAPALVFFDEVDALAGGRGGDNASSGSGSRAVSQLLVEMDGCQPSLGVVVLAATNRPDRVDPALLRPGRLDLLLHVRPPDAHERAKILELKLKRTPLVREGADTVDLREVARRAERFTGADLAALAREAALAALEQGEGAVGMGHLLKALGRVVPSAPAAGDPMEAVYRRFERAGGGGGCREVAQAEEGDDEAD